MIALQEGAGGTVLCMLCCGTACRGSAVAASAGLDWVVFASLARSYQLSCCGNVTLTQRAAYAALP